MYLDQRSASRTGAPRRGNRWQPRYVRDWLVSAERCAVRDENPNFVNLETHPPEWGERDAQERIERSLKRAKQQAEPARASAPACGPPPLVCASSVTPRAVEWVLPGLLARGKLHTLDGDPGLGKSTLALDLCARASRGAEMPLVNATASLTNVLYHQRGG